MKRYGQFCPVAKAAEVFCTRWTPLILRDLAAGPRRFSQLQRGVPLASPSLLSARLKELEAEGIVTREKTGSGNAWLYRLTEAGAEFAPIILALGTWGMHWTRRALAEGEISLDLLLWALEQSSDPAAFGRGRTLVELRFTDQPEHKRRWWFLNTDGTLEFCIRNPGHEVDLYVDADLPAMIHVWRGDMTLRAALADGRIELHGSRAARDAFPGWLGISQLAHVPSRAPSGIARQVVAVSGDG